MGDDSFQISETNHGLIKDNKNRIENLFDVHIGLEKHDGGNWSCVLSAKACSSPESLVKAKTYIRSLLGVGEDYYTSVVSYDVKCVEMILQNRDEIERNTAVVILPGQHPNDISLQGPLNHLLVAKNVIESFLRQRNECLNEVNTLFNSQSVSSQTALRNSSLTPLNESILVGDNSGEVYSRNFDGLADNFAHLGLDPSHLSSQIQDNSTDSSDSEDVILDIGNDPDYESKVEFALKLGYQEKDLVQALYKVGVDADQNELLSELIKQGSSSSDGTTVADTRSHDDGGQVLSQYGEDKTSVGHWQRKRKDGTDNLRHIIIDGSNIAMSHGNKETFSCQGIKLAVDWFRERGHKDITVFVPQWRKETSRSDSRMKDQTILNELEKDKVLVFTPARRIGGKRVVCYDDRYILKLAVDTDGIVVSNDNYRDLSEEKEEFKKVVEERLLMYSFVNDRFMPPDDPLGRNGPTLDAFLQKEPPLPKSLPQLCPYGSKKCTYGNKCKFYHPEKRNVSQKSVTEKLAEQAKQRMIEVKERGVQESKKPATKMSLCRARSLNPGDIKGDTNLQSMGSHQPSDQKLTDNDEHALFNQKLAENLRKMTREKDLKESQSKILEKKTKKKNKDSQFSPRWNFQPGDISPRGASPISNLHIPGLEGEFVDDDDKFLSGHLLLAKKLSDEANESEKIRKQPEKQKKESPLVSGQGTSLSYNFSEISPAVKEPKKGKQKLARAPQKQALSRQLSLQGTEDPRIRQEHGQLKPQYSYGGATQQSKNKLQNPDEINSLMKDFMQGQSQTFVDQQNPGIGGRKNVSQTREDQGHQYPKKSTLTRMPSEGFTPAAVSGYPNMLNIPAHTPLARMQSAPDSYMLKKQQVKSQPRMTRQNSSSDTQLNKLEGVEEPYLPPSQPMYNPVLDTMLVRAHFPRPMSSKQVSYQFGSPGVSTEGMHGRPMDSTIQQSPNINPQAQVNQHINPHMIGIQQQQVHLLNRNVPGSFAPTQQNMGYMYRQGLPLGQSLQGPVHSSRASFCGPVNQPQNSTNMGGFVYQQGGAQFGPGPPHFLDQQTSQIWGMEGSYASQSSYSGVNQPNIHSLSPMFSNPHLQQQNKASPVLYQFEGISTSDPRYELYCNLCKLFPADKVLSVMIQHPELDRPDEICAYLIGAK